MSNRVEESGVVEAEPAIVYRILADYATHHPRILPKPWFESISVEKGGVGAGTVLRVGMKVMGARKDFVVEVSEPEPGRLLREVDVENRTATEFRLAPEDGGRKTRVTIATEWAPKPGLRGWIEGKMTPRVLRPIYRAELAKLAEYAPSVR